MIENSHAYRDKLIRAQRLKLILWQGDNALGGVRSDVCSIVAKYTDDQIINDMKESGKCYTTNTTKLNTNLAGLWELFKVEVITPIQFLLSTKRTKSDNSHDEWKFT